MSDINNKYYFAYKSSHRIKNITFFDLHFSPRKLNEQDYLELKNKLFINNDFIFYSKNDFFLFYNQELILFGICILLLGLIKIVHAQWLFEIALLVNLFGVYVLFLFTADIKEYIEYSDLKSKYISDLKEDLFNSIDFDEFVIRQRERNPYLYK